MNYDVKIIENTTVKRPQVLLIGNGILQAITGAKWDELLLSVSKHNISGITKSTISQCNKIPYSIKANVLSSFDDKKRREEYTNYLLKEYLKYYSNENPLINKLLDVDCNIILTTNYTYELENHIYNSFYAATDDTKRKYTYTTNRKVTKENDSTKLSPGLSEFYRLEYKNGQSKDIWHIHGEAGKKSSLILTHDEYGRLTRDILNFNKIAGNKYEKYKKNLRIKSWVDYFLIADIYIIGFGLDYSEFDIWWLLNRRKREKAKCGQIYFFEPSDFGNENIKYHILREFDIIHRDCGTAKPIGLTKEEENELNNNFYGKAIDEIKELIEAKGETKK